MIAQEYVSIETREMTIMTISMRILSRYEIIYYHYNFIRHTKEISRFCYISFDITVDIK